MTNKIKIQRYESLIKNIINNCLNYEIKDKIASHATVTYVKLSNDLSFANVYIDCLYDNSAPKIIDHLNKIKGFIKHRLTDYMNTYKVPELRFSVDESLRYAQKIENILKQLNEKENKD